MKLPSKDKLLYYLQEAMNEVAYALLVGVSKVAYKRGDIHEFEHSLEAILVGNNYYCKSDPDTCYLLEDYKPDASLSEQTEQIMDSVEDLDIEAWLDEL